MSTRNRAFPMLTFRAEITVEVVALDYVEAADHQKGAQALFAAVKAQYPDATFTFRQLRPRTRPRSSSGPRGSTRAVYDDV